MPRNRSKYAVREGLFEQESSSAGVPPHERPVPSSRSDNRRSGTAAPCAADTPSDILVKSVTLQLHERAGELVGNDQAFVSGRKPCIVCARIAMLLPKISLQDKALLGIVAPATKIVLNRVTDLNSAAAEDRAVQVEKKQKQERGNGTQIGAWATMRQNAANSDRNHTALMTNLLISKGGTLHGERNGAHRLLTCILACNAGAVGFLSRLYPR
jgi:hypothetical protein